MDAQIANWITVLGSLGKLGVKVMCYNFMPQILADAMVVRTSETEITRGGSMTTAFRVKDITQIELSIDPEQSQGEVGENLAYFLSRVIPAAENAGIRLAMHPDDPLWSLLMVHTRIMSSAESFEWLMAVNPSPSNALILCAGCLGEMEENPSDFARKHADRIALDL